MKNKSKNNIKTSYSLLVDDIKDRIKDKRDIKYDLINLVYLILPALLIAVIVSLSLYSFFFSILLIYFVLPMHYAVDLRLRSSISSIGNRRSSYKKGYDEFFGERAGGTYGLIVGVSQFILLTLVFSFIFSAALKPLCSMNNESKTAYFLLFEDTSDNSSNWIKLTFENIQYLYKPFVIYLSLVLFFPMTFLFMYHVNHNLSKHHMMSIVFPDADKNMPVSYQESLCEYTLCRYYRKDEFLLSLRFNWPYYLAHTAIYILLAYVFTLFKPNNGYVTIYLLSTLLALTSFIDIILNYFIMKNKYLIVEAISTVLEKRLPIEVKMSFAKIFQAPGYKHGEESALRGSFFTSEYYENEKQNEYTEADFTVKENNEKPSDNDNKVEGNVVDLSSFKPDDKKDDLNN